MPRLGLSPMRFVYEMFFQSQKQKYSKKVGFVGDMLVIAGSTYTATWTAITVQIIQTAASIAIVVAGLIVGLILRHKLCTASQKNRS